MGKNIEIKGAAVNNLKNIDLKLPLNKFIVLTGVSGSGKSSLAFDTLYAEGQRRYVESLSAYARQFLGRMSKPQCDYIKGLPPAIAIEQKVNTRNPRSTVGTSTEIYDYMRMLFARVGHTYSPVSGIEVKKHGVEDVVRTVAGYPEGTRAALVIDIRVPEGRSLRQQLEIYLKEGYTRLEQDGSFIDISDVLAAKEEPKPGGYRLLIDRFTVSTDKDEVSRLTDSVETAYFEGHDECIVMVWGADGVHEHAFSKRFTADGIDFREPNDLMFNFNNPYGACPECEGFGKVMGISEDLVVPDKSLSVYQDAVQCWRGEKMSECKKELIHIAPHFNFPIHTPYSELTKAQKRFLWEGNSSWPGINGFFRWVDENQYKIQYRVLKARYRGKTTCPTCGGSRLRPDVEYVKVSGKTITELVRYPIKELRAFFDTLELPENDAAIAARLLTEIRHRLRFLDEVGLGYLTLDRLSSSLSGGESQRINLATSLGSSLVGSLYILDEPSIGLHSRDTQRLIGVLRSLQQLGNTVVVVEHDEATIREADDIIELGPGSGAHGGDMVFHGSFPELIKRSDTLTAKYMRGDLSVPIPDERREPKGWLTLRGVTTNNLKDIDCPIPLGTLTCVTGVSGSGKSSLVVDTLYKHLALAQGIRVDQPGSIRGIDGVEAIERIAAIDQTPIGRTPRSNPATYTKIFDEIRNIFAMTPDARKRGYQPGRFSFNVKGGRCEACSGDGQIRVEMHFLPDVYVTCDVCKGKRYNHETLEVRYRGLNISEVLDMPVREARQFFSSYPVLERRLAVLEDVGLDYIRLGQPATTLSGGEAQRIKISRELGKRSLPGTMYILDEPTTGLHMHEVGKLVTVLHHLVDLGATVVVIEHNTDVILASDYVIDLGPGGGENGGRIVPAGTPEAIMADPNSVTGKFLTEERRTRRKLGE